MSVPDFLKGFIETVKKFAANTTDVIYADGQLIVDIQDTLYELTFRRRGGALYCIENEREYPVDQWIVERLGRLDTLARRILEYVPEDKYLIPIASQFENFLDVPDAESFDTEDTLPKLQKFLGNDDHLTGMTKITYLTADAGEGKTTLIESLARKQAQAYLDRETDWLLLPIWLGGRSFIRLDDIIIGSLTNRLRFPYYYYESILELVKLQSVVLALDGFEEMFVVNSQTDDAVSSLGSLVSRLDSNGNILVAARTAYYNYRDSQSQARLFQSISKKNYVTFAEVKLKRWTKDQFLDLANALGVKENNGAENLYDTICNTLSSKHPLLTRAVLARKLINTFLEASDQEAFLRQLSSSDGGMYFEQFVKALLEREAIEKWIDRGEVARPLLSVEDHIILLTAIAEEMWRSGEDALSGDVLKVTTELILSDELHKPSVVVEQAKFRITTHALLRLIEGTKRYEFDHEEFKSFFVGCKIADILRVKDRNLYEIRSFFRLKQFTDLSVEVSIAQLFAGNTAPCRQNLSSDLSKIASESPRTSYARQNIGSILIKSISTSDILHEDSITIRDAHFNSDSLKNVQLNRIQFETCIFERTGLDNSSFKNVHFVNCEVMYLELLDNAELNGLDFDENSMPIGISVLGVNDSVGESEKHFYSPQDIVQVLSNFGAKTPSNLENSTPIHNTKIIEEEYEIIITHRIYRYFQRTTALNENVLKTKLGTDWYRFEKDILPRLLEASILREDEYRGRGNQKRFLLGLNFDEAEKIRADSNGKFSSYLELARNKEDK